MHGGFYTHYALGDTFERMAPSLVFGLLLVCRLVIWFQVKAREKRDEEFLRKLYEEASNLNNQDNEMIGVEEEEEVDTDDREERVARKKKQPNGGNTLTLNKKNVGKHVEKEEKKIK